MNASRIAQYYKAQNDAARDYHRSFDSLVRKYGRNLSRGDAREEYLALEAKSEKQDEALQRKYADVQEALMQEHISAAQRRRATKRNGGFIGADGSFHPIRGTEGAPSYAPTRMGKMKSKTAKVRDAEYRRLKREKSEKAAKAFLKKTAIRKPAKRATKRNPTTNGLFDSESVTRARPVERLQRVRETSRGEKGTVVKTFDDGWVKVKLDNGGHWLASPDVIERINPAGKNRVVIVAAAPKRVAKAPKRVAKAPKRNGLVGRVVGRRKAARAYRRELRHEAAVTRAHTKRKQYEREALEHNPPTNAFTKLVDRAAVLLRKNNDPETVKAQLEKTGERPQRVARAVRAAMSQRAAAPARNPAKRAARKQNSAPPKPTKKTLENFHEFQGREATHLLKVDASHMMPKASVNGELVAIKLKGGKELRAPADSHLLADARKRLWISGKLGKPNFKLRKDDCTLEGDIEYIVYRTIKEHLGDKAPVSYIHHLGEDTGAHPQLYIDRNGYGVVRGGDYTQDWRGVIN